MKLLTATELGEIHRELSCWKLDIDAKRLEREFSFSDFRQAFGFMQQVAQAAEAMDHHPDWSNSFNKVRITLTTHSAGGLTSLDLALAKAIDQLSSRV